MSALVNRRYEAVAQARAKGASQKQAVVAAGFTSEASANRVCRRPEVLMRVKELNPNAGINASIRWDGKLKPIRQFHRRRPGKKPVITLDELICDLMQLSREARANGEHAVALRALSQANDLRMERDGNDPLNKNRTKGQREQDVLRDLNEEDPADEQHNAHYRATPSLSEIDRALGEFDDNPGNGAEEEQAGPVASGDQAELPEPDRSV